MEIHPSIGSVVAQTTETQWGQVLLTPHAYGVVEIKEQDGGAMQLGISVLTKLTDQLRSPVVSLRDLEKIVQNIEGRWLESLLLLVPVGGVVYLAVQGQGTIYIKRNNRLAKLMDGPGGLSGEVKEGDTLLLVTPSFTQAISEETILGVFDDSSARDVAEKLTLLLHETKEVVGAAALIFQIHTVNESASVQSAIAQPSTPLIQKEKLSTQPARAVKRHAMPVAMGATFASLFSGIGAFVKDKTKRKTMIALLCVLFFAGSVFVGIQKQTVGRKNQQVTRIVADAQHAFDEGSALVDLNPTKGRERLVQAKELLDPLVDTVSPKSDEGRMVGALYEQIKDRLTLAMHIVKAQPTLFYDVSLLKNTARADDIAFFDGTLAALDRKGPTAFFVTGDTKNGQVIGGGSSYTGASHIGIGGDSVYVLVSEGIHKIRISDKKTVPLVVKKSSEWGSIFSVSAFGGNLYLLDSQKSRIWKYVATESGFSELREYLNPDTLPDLSKATSMAIDGSVWIGTGDGKILRFTQGKENTFLIQGVDPSFGSNISVYTSDEEKNVYVLDPDNKRIVVLDKEGVYVAQYVWEGDENPTQFVVSESQKKILLLIDGKIYLMELT